MAQTQESEWTEDYGQPRWPIVEDLGDEDYRWLFEMVFPVNIRLAFPAESFKSFRVHLKDSHRVFPEPTFIQQSNLKKIRQVRGHITYVGFFPKQYAYDILQDSDGELILQVRVHLKNATIQDRTDFSSKTKMAEYQWNASRPEMDFPYRFDFEIVKDPRQAHFSVNIKDTTRGPYDTNWGRDWTSNVIAHEIGHMLGLGDEYQTLSGVFDCYKPSLMCSAWGGALMKHHYYFVLRRLLK